MYKVFNINTLLRNLLILLLLTVTSMLFVHGKAYADNGVTFSPTSFGIPYGGYTDYTVTVNNTSGNTIDTLDYGPSGTGDITILSMTGCDSTDNLGNPGYMRCATNIPSGQSKTYTIRFAMPANGHSAYYIPATAWVGGYGSSTYYDLTPRVAFFNQGVTFSPVFVSIPYGGYTDYTVTVNNTSGNTIDTLDYGPYGTGDITIQSMTGCDSTSDDFGYPGYIRCATNIPSGQSKTYTIRFAMPANGHSIGYIPATAWVGGYGSSTYYALTPGAFFFNSPVINQNFGATVNEGDTYSASSSFSESGANSWTATVDYGDGSGLQSLPLSGTNFSLSHVYKDNGTYAVTVSVTDNLGTTGTGTATVTVNNIAPSVGTITAPSSPVLVNTAITASANFTDPGVLDTHTASWDWGDGNTTPGTVTESNGSGSVAPVNHTYTATGVYTITLTVTDKDGGQGTSTFQYVAVYDSSSSFAGGRSFDNPASASPSTSGKVSFGISSKFSNSNVLTGSVKMDFKAANLDFASTSLQSLATSNGKAYLKGSGTVNGSGNYTFLATGIDGSVVGGNDLIRFQIKDASNAVIYDSQPGASDTTDPTTVDANGNIRVH